MFSSSVTSHWRTASLLPIGLMTVLGALGCTSPGMKLDLKASRDTTLKVDDFNVKFHPLKPESLGAMKARESAPDDLSALLSEQAAPYRLGPQDIILVTIWDHPEIMQPWGQYRSDTASGLVVEDDGCIFFPYAGRLKVQGKTVSQVREEMTQLLGRSLRNPQIDVKMLMFRSQKVYIDGEVRNPAVYPITDVPMSLAEGINRTGGFLPTADDSRLLLTRGEKTWSLDFYNLMLKGNLTGRIQLKDGDTLHVPSLQEEPVYMLGEVLKTGTLPFSHGHLSLARALTDSGGISGNTADARSVYVIRQGSAGWVDVFHLDARNPTAMVLADHFDLRPRDVVYVDAGTLVRFNRVMSMILPTVSAVSSLGLTGAEVRYLKGTR